MNRIIKKILIITLSVLVGIFLLFYILENTDFVVTETYLKYRLAPRRYPSLNFVSVNDVKNTISQDSNRLKVLCYCECLDKSDTKYIRENVIPKWLESDTSSISLYIIVSDCALLTDTNAFKDFDIPSAHFVVIRDNSKQFRSYGGIFPELHRTFRLTEYIAPSENLNMVTVKSVNAMHSLMLDRHNNVKLCKIHGITNTGPKSHIITMPFETLSNTDSIDFNTIDSVSLADFPEIPLCWYLDD